MRLLIISVYLLITYGSLFPFNFSLLELNQQYTNLLSIKFSGIGDILANIFLFVPLGFLYAVNSPNQNTFLNLDKCLLLIKVLIFSILLQLMQIGLPSRDQNITDVAFNMLGFMLALYSMAFIKLPTFKIKPKLTFLPIAIALTYLLSELPPFVPALDFQQVKNSIKPLLILPTWYLSVDVFFKTLMWLVVIRLTSFEQIKPSIKGVLLLWLAMLFAKVIIYSNQVTFSDLIAPLIAILVSVYINIQQQGATKLLLIAVLGAFFASSISPITSFHFTPSDLLPFSGYLSGQLVVGIQGLLYKIFLFSSIIWFAFELSFNVKKTTYILAAFVGLIEFSQLFMQSRVTDFADVLLVFIAYHLVRNLGDYLVQKETSNQYDDIHNESTCSADDSQAYRYLFGISPVQKSTLGLILIFTSFYFVVNFSLSLPGVPYNVVELFVHHGSVLDLLFFLSFLLLLGGCSTYIAKQVNQNDDISVISFIGLHFISLAIIFVCLWCAVTNESIEDIVGASKIRQAIYAAQASQHFFMVLFNILSLSLMANIGEFIEFLLRFSALFGLFQIPLSFFFLCSNKNTRLVKKVQFAIVSFILLLLCYLSVFTFAVTDNITELIAKPTTLVIGIIIFTIITVMARRLLFNGMHILAILLTIVCASVSWLIAQYVFELVIVKYGHVFSAFDFLIGAGREQKMSEKLLIIRWVALVFSFQWVLILGSIFFDKIPKIEMNKVRLSKFKNYIVICLSVIMMSYIGNRLFGEHMHWQTLVQYFSKASSYAFVIDESTSFIPTDAVAGDIYLNEKRVPSLASAFQQAKSEDVIRLSKGYYNEAAILNANNVRIVAALGAVIYGKSSEGKGALVIKGDNTYIEGLECHSVYVPDNNGVCIRLEGKGIHLNKVYFHHAQGGLLGSHQGGDIRIENSRFEHLGDGAFYHGIYTLEETRLFINNSSFVNNRNGGHEIKSRSYHTEITNSVIASSQSRDSRLIDVPNGGVLIIQNNVLIEGPFSENHDLLSWGVEGVTHIAEQLIITDNMVISDKRRARLISLKREPNQMKISDNIVVGKVSGFPLEHNLFFSSRASLSIPPAPFIPPLKGEFK